MNAILRAGRMRRRIVIKKKSVERDRRGQQSGELETAVTLWAGYRYKSFEHGAMNSGAELTSAIDIFLIRFRTDIKQQMVVDWNGNLYEIDHVVEVGQRRALELHCRRVS